MGEGVSVPGPAPIHIHPYRPPTLPSLPPPRTRSNLFIMMHRLLESGQLAFNRNAFLLPPATKLGQGYIFTAVCESVHRGGLPQCMLGYHIPQEQTSPHPPQSRPPPRPGTHLPRPGTPHPGADTPPQYRACWEIRSTRGR